MVFVPRQIARSERCCFVRLPMYLFTLFSTRVARTRKQVQVDRILPHVFLSCVLCFWCCFMLLLLLLLLPFFCSGGSWKTTKLLSPWEKSSRRIDTGRWVVVFGVRGGGGACLIFSCCFPCQTTPCRVPAWYDIQQAWWVLWLLGTRRVNVHTCTRYST